MCYQNVAVAGSLRLSERLKEACGTYRPQGHLQLYEPTQKMFWKGQECCFTSCSVSWKASMKSFEGNKFPFLE